MYHSYNSVTALKELFLNLVMKDTKVLTSSGNTYSSKTKEYYVHAIHYLISIYRNICLTRLCITYVYVYL